MKLRASLLVVVLAMLLMAGVAGAQQPPAVPADRSPLAETGTVANPVSTTVKAQLARFTKNMVAAAEAMPAEKYNFKPTPEMNSFGHLVMHIAQSNHLLCAKISGQTAPDVKLADTDTKEKLVAGLKDSFTYCAAMLEKTNDANLGDSMMLFGKNPTSRAAAWIALSDGWNDHYGAQAIYLRLNGMLPPTAQPAKKE